MKGQFCSFTGWLDDPGLRMRATELAIEENEANHPAQADLAFMAERFAAAGLRDADAEREALIATSNRLWQPGREIKVHFLEGGQYPEARDQALEFFREWTNYANLSFVREPNRDASEIRVTFKSGGSWSLMGTSVLATPKDRPTMQLGWFLRQRPAGVCYHEMGHAIGFQHEQGSPDRHCEYNRQAVIDDLSGPPNNWDLQTIEFNVFRRSTSTQYSRWDRDSIMQYFEPPEWFFDPSCAAGPNDVLSRRDKKYARLWYPEPSDD